MQNRMPQQMYLSKFGAPGDSGPSKLKCSAQPGCPLRPTLANLQHPSFQLGNVLSKVECPQLSRQPTYIRQILRLLDLSRRRRPTEAPTSPPKMRSNLLTPLALSFLSVAAAAATTTVNLVIPPTNLLPNPRSLPPQTHATLSSFHFGASAYLSPANTFAFHNVSEGSYLLDVHSPTHVFAPLRVDVLPVVAGAGQTEKEEKVARLKVAAWETYRGNDWNNKGEAAAVTNGGALEVKVLGPKNFFVERSGCKWSRKVLESCGYGC